MRHTIVIAGLLLLAGCSNVTALKEKAPQANDYAGALASEYLEYADSRAELGRHDAAEHFAGKGLQALGGESVLPDEVSDRLAESFKAPLAKSRADLLSVINEDVKRVAPQKLARVQLLYDCWQHQAQVDGSSSPCREEFESNMIALEEVVDSFAYSQLSRHEIGFTGASAKLDDVAMSALMQVAEQVRRLPRYKIALSGYSGSDKSKRKLSSRRVQVVRAALVQQGLAEARIEQENARSDKAVYLSCDEGLVAKDTVLVTVKTIANSALSSKE